jgi:phage gp36-like protein
MTETEAQKCEQARQSYTSYVKAFQPTIVGVVSLGSETSRQMKEDNRKRRLEALKKRK